MMKVDQNYPVFYILPNPSLFPNIVHGYRIHLYSCRSLLVNTVLLTTPSIIIFPIALWHFSLIQHYGTPFPLFTATSIPLTVTHYRHSCMYVLITTLDASPNPSLTTLTRAEGGIQQQMAPTHQWRPDQS